MATHAYWRVNISASWFGVNIAIAEIEMRATRGGADQCAGGTVIKSVEQVSFAAVNAFDNNTATAWAANNTIPAWIGYHFAAAVDVLEIAITADATFFTIAPRDFTVDFSDDGISWTTAWTELLAINWTSGETRTFHFATNLEATKSVAYGTLGSPQALHTTKATPYAVLGPPLLISCTKKVMYVITGPDNGARQRIKVRYVKSHR